MEEENNQWVFPEEDTCEVACVILGREALPAGTFMCALCTCIIEPHLLEGPGLDGSPGPLLRSPHLH